MAGKFWYKWKRSSFPLPHLSSDLVDMDFALSVLIGNCGRMPAYWLVWRWLWCLLCKRVGSGRCVCRRCDGIARSKKNEKIEKVRMHTVFLALWTDGEMRTYRLVRLSVCCLLCKQTDTREKIWRCDGCFILRVGKRTRMKQVKKWLYCWGCCDSKTGRWFYLCEDKAIFPGYCSFRMRLRREWRCLKYFSEGMNYYFTFTIFPVTSNLNLYCK